MNAVEQIVLAIADGTVSPSRVKKIAQALFAVDLDVFEIKEICRKYSIPMPKKEPVEDPILVQYPDKYSFFLEGVNVWRIVKKLWGIEAAVALFQVLQTADDPLFRALYVQIPAYTAFCLADRRPINLNPAPLYTPLPTEKHYSCQVQRIMFLRAFLREAEKAPVTWQKTSQMIPVIRDLTEQIWAGKDLPLEELIELKKAIEVLEEENDWQALAPRNPDDPHPLKTRYL